MTDPLLAMTRVWLLYSATKLEMFVGKKQCPIAVQRAWGRLPKWYGREDIVGLWISDVQSNWCVYPWVWRGQAVIVMRESFWWATVTGRIVTGWERWLCPWSEIPMTNALGDNTRIYFCLLEYEAGTVNTGQQSMPNLVYGPSVVPSTEWFSQFVGCTGAAEQQGKTFAQNIPCCWRRAHLLWPSIGASLV